jgi:hypothetical protein
MEFAATHVPITTPTVTETMLWRLMADIVVVVHFAFVLFVLLGGFLVLRWRRLAWIHIPAAVWGVLIEFAGWICPLTPLEQWLRIRGGEAGHAEGFIEHYLLAWLYPAGLTRKTQLILGALALLVNLIAYGLVVYRHRRMRGQ